MAFDFNGTFNASQYQRFAAYARSQLQDVGARINHLAAEQQRIGVLTFAYDASGQPLAYTPQPVTSQLGQLLAIYEMLGGDAFYDLNVRLVTQPVVLLKGDETTPAQVLSNGEIMGQAGLADRGTAELMDQARGWLSDVLDGRKEQLERKIRRLIDYQDQLAAEQELLATITAGADVETSLEGIFAAMQAYLDDPTYRPVYDDKGKDPFGKMTYAPMLPYSSGPDRVPTDVYGKDAGDTGVVVPGEQAGSGSET